MFAFAVLSNNHGEPIGDRKCRKYPVRIGLERVGINLRHCTAAVACNGDRFGTDSSLIDSCVRALDPLEIMSDRNRFGE